MFPARVCDRCVGIGTIHSGSTDTIPRSTVMFLCIHQMLFCREDSCPTGDRNCRNHHPYQLYGRSLRESRHPSKAPIALRETFPARRPTNLISNYRLKHGEYLSLCLEPATVARPQNSPSSLHITPLRHPLSASPEQASAQHNTLHSTTHPFLTLTACTATTAHSPLCARVPVWYSKNVRRDYGCSICSVTAPGGSSRAARGGKERRNALTALTAIVARHSIGRGKRDWG